MNFREELSLLVRSRYPLIYIPTREEERAEMAIATVAQDLSHRAVYTWDYIDGYQGNPTDNGFGRRNPLQALELIEKVPASAAAIFILRDFHRFLDDIGISRKLRNLLKLLKSQPKNVVILSAELTVPDELSSIITVLEFPLPDVSEIRTEVEQILSATGSQLSARD
ncbi:MAG: AAA family ATPase, partial [Cyanobacteria bacterium J06555_13]